MYEVPANIASKLTNQQISFLEEIQEYIGCKFYYYGSIERMDYMPGKSDIDIDVITPNVYSTLFKLRQFLSTPEQVVQNIMWTARKPVKYTFYCKKIKFANDFIKLELSIYDEKYKSRLLEIRDFKRDIPLSALMIVYILKTFYYKLNMISTSNIAAAKKFIMGSLLDMEDDYIVIKNT